MTNDFPCDENGFKAKKTHLDSSISLKHVSIAQNMYIVLGEGGGGREEQVNVYQSFYLHVDYRERGRVFISLHYQYMCILAV